MMKTVKVDEVQRKPKNRRSLVLHKTSCLHLSRWSEATFKKGGKTENRNLMTALGLVFFKYISKIEKGHSLKITHKISALKQVLRVAILQNTYVMGGYGRLAKLVRAWC